MKLDSVHLKKCTHKWLPLSLLNLNTKLMLRFHCSPKSKYLLWYTGVLTKKGKLIFDFIEITNTLTIRGFLLTLDFEKAVDLTKQNSLMNNNVIEKAGIKATSDLVSKTDKNDNPFLFHCFNMLS